MYDLLSRTFSQGLQAFLPIAFGLSWFRRTEASDAAAGLRWGMLAAVPVTFAAMYGIQRSSRQSLIEAVLAAGTLAAAIWFARRVQRDVPAPPISGARLPFAIAATLVIVRQTMEIAVALSAALQLRAADPLLALAAGILFSAAAAAAWYAIGTRIRNSAIESATRTFAVLFVLQVAFYLFHESAEAGLLPWSEVLHTATEPYGPDGVYGRYISTLLFVVPLAVAAVRSRGPRADEERRARPALSQGLAVAAAVVLVVSAELVSVVGLERGGARTPVRSGPPALAVTAMTTVPHLLFRHMAADPNYGQLSVTPLAAPGFTPRAAATLRCDRIAFAAGRGVCLSAERDLFTTYKIVFFDGALSATSAVKLEGSPSRTRISPDGRLGAFTVFAVGSAHTYKGSSFSTRTVILDMTTGSELGDLEQFTAWRDGTRLKGADFNFWGVTFARDSNVFYATLRTEGTTYLVRGDLRLRTLTVLRDNVECPALSPDNRLLGFKKRVGPGDDPWRFYVLDLATMTDRPIVAETRSIDDQLEWLDETHVLYGAPRSGQPSSRDVWIAPIDGSGPARIFLPDAESPIVVR